LAADRDEHRSNGRAADRDEHRIGGIECIGGIEHVTK
jgi:hypothetical protein